MTHAERGLTLPAYYTYFETPVKMVPAPEGGLAAWRLDRNSGGWKPANDLVDEILFAMGGDISVLTAEQFVQWTEYERALYLEGEGAVFALYETVKAIEDTAAAERRRLTAREQALISGIRRRTFVMFEEALQRAGDHGADPSIAAGQA